MDPNSTIKDAHIFPGKLDWFSAAGNLILNFGTLEWLILSFLEKRLDATEFDRCRTSHFKDRLAIVADCFKDLDHSPDDQKAFMRFSEELETIRNLRNHVAHAHLTINLEQGLEPRVTLSLPRNLDRPFDSDARILEFAELCEGLDRLNEASELFQRISRFGETGPTVA